MGGGGEEGAPARGIVRNKWDKGENGKSGGRFSLSKGR